MNLLPENTAPDCPAHHPEFEDVRCTLEDGHGGQHEAIAADAWLEWSWTHLAGCEHCLDHDGLPFHAPELDTAWPTGDREWPTCAVCGHELGSSLAPEVLSTWTPAESDVIEAHDEGAHLESGNAEPGCPRCDEGADVNETQSISDRAERYGDDLDPPEYD